MRGAGRWMLSFLVALFLSLWLGVATLQMTILNRHMVEGWLQGSGLYQNLIDSLPMEVPGATEKSFIAASDIKEALATTFTPSFLQTQSETVLNSTYDWLEGKQPKITFSIPINQKKAEFAANLAQQLEPKIAALPQCTTRLAPSTDQPTCLPKGMSAASYAAELSNLVDSDGQDFLNKPITQDDLGNGQSRALSWLPAVVPNVDWMVVALPLLAFAAAAGYVLLSEDKMKGLATIGRRTFFHGLVVCILGGAIWFFGQSVQIDSLIPAAVGSEAEQTLVKNLIEPIVHRVAQDVGQVLTLLSGSIALVGAATWLTGHVIRRRLEDKKSLNSTPTAPPMSNDPTPPTPPTPVM